MMKKSNLLFFFSLFTVVTFAQTDTTLSYNESLAAHRKAYLEDFITNDHAPLKATDTAFVQFFPIDQNYLCLASLELTPEAKPFDMMTYSGQTRQYIQYAWLNSRVNGNTIQLAVYKNLTLRNVPGYEDYFFLPFKDVTNGELSYGGGRYLDFRLHQLQAPDIQLDFNKAYNPYCAYSDGYSCPIPPKENHLNIEILAGEKMFIGEHKERKH